MSTTKEMKILLEFVDWTESEFARSLSPQSKASNTFVAMQAIVENLADTLLRLDPTTGVVYLNGTQREVIRAVRNIQDIDNDDLPDAIAFQDIKKFLKPGTQLLDLDQFPHARELAFDLVLAPTAEREHAQAIVKKLKEILPFQLPERILLSEAERCTANPGGGLSYFENSADGTVVCVISYSSTLVNESGRVAENQHGIDSELFEWDPQCPHTDSRLEMYEKLAMTDIPNGMVSSIADMVSENFPQFSYLMYASLKWNVATRLASEGARLPYLLHSLTHECVKDALTGHPFCHGAISTYFDVDKFVGGMGNMERATEALRGQLYLQQRVALRLNPSNLDDKKIGQTLIHSMTLRLLRERQPQQNDRVSKTFTPGRMKYLKKDEATLRLRVIRDLYVEGALDVYPPARDFARRVVSSALLVCPDKMTGDLKPWPFTTNAPHPTP